jgi:hypothetical protein
MFANSRQFRGIFGRFDGVKRYEKRGIIGGRLWDLVSDFVPFQARGIEFHNRPPDPRPGAMTAHARIHWAAILVTVLAAPRPYPAPTDPADRGRTRRTRPG